MQIRVGSSELYYLRYGRGVPVLMVHGGPGLSHSYFRPFVDGLGDCAELIYFDQRGNGRSGGGEAVGQATLEGWADDVEALRAALKLPPCVVLGHGFGGFVAQLYAHRHPERVRGLILCNATPALDYPVQMLTRARDYASQEALAALMGCIAGPARDDVALRASWRQALPAYFYRYQPMYGAAIDDGLAYSAAVYNRGLFELAPTFSSVPLLPEVKTPTLIVAGAHDWWAPPEEATGRLQALLPHARTHLFEHSGHYPFVEEATGFCHAVRRFLRDLAPPVGAVH